MKLSKAKVHDQTSTNNLIIESKIPVAKQNTTEEFSVDENYYKISKEFYLFELFVLALGLISNIYNYVKHHYAITILVVSSGLFIIMMIMSLFIFILEKKSKFCKKIARPCIFLLGGLFMIFSDPEILDLFIANDIVSYCPSILQLILVTVLQSTSKCSVNLNFISFFLGVFAMFLTVPATKIIQQSIYLAIVNSLICIKLLQTKNSLKKCNASQDKYFYDDESEDLDYLEIISNLQNVIKRLNKLKEVTKIDTINNLTEMLEKIWISLKKNQNIYKAKIETITKNMDEQDKIFIEESCFTSLANIVGRNVEHSDIKQYSSNSYGVSELIGCLKQIGIDWNFNTFFVHDCSGKEPIQVIGSYSISRYGLDELFTIPEVTIKNYFKKIENGYRDNPYHNSIHGADVLCSYLYLVNNSDIYKHMSSTELLGGIIATSGHDIGHPGMTNRFLVLTKDDIAIAYNDISVLEMMHASIVFNILTSNESNILCNLSSEKWIIIRKCIIDMILATDMSKHFDMMGQFKVKYHELDYVDLDKPDIRNDLFKLMMKSADIGHAAKSTELHEKWCALVVEEFYEQGDLEKKLGISVSMYCDRESTDISKSQAGFIKNIVYPLFTTLNSILVSEMIEIHCLSQLRNNELYWIMRRKTIRGQSLISKKEEYVNCLNYLNSKRKSDRKQSLPSVY